MTVLTGRNRGPVRLYLPQDSDELFVQGLVQALWQLDHVADVTVDGRVVSVTNDLVPLLKGQAFVDTLVEFDNEVTAVLQGMINLLELETKQAARQVMFSHR